MEEELDEATSVDSIALSSLGAAETNARPGRIGIPNIGNSCFINAAIQCLSNTRVEEFFATGAYKNELNLNNSLGTRGQVGLLFADFLDRLWRVDAATSSSSPSPPPTSSSSYPAVDLMFVKRFKESFAQFAMQFADSSQQDAQEFIAMLLDYVHEDFNRIVNKPYTESVEDKGKPDEEVARESWIKHLLRNNSIIVDLFHGLFKSTIECQVCHSISRAFDPFLFLSVPLPAGRECTVRVLLVENKKEIPTEFCLITSRAIGTVGDLKAQISEFSGINSGCLQLSEVFNNRILNVHPDTKFVKEFSPTDRLIVYEVEAKPEVKKPTSALGSAPAPVPPTLMAAPPLIHIRATHRKRLLPVADENPKRKTGNNTRMFGTPLLLSVKTTNATNRDLYCLVWQKVKHFVEPAKLSSLMSEPEWETKIHELFALQVCNSTSSDSGKPIPNNTDKLVSLSERSNTIGIDWLDFNDQHLEQEETKKEEHESVRIQFEKQQQKLTLEDCIRLFTTRESLGNDDLWRCPDCKLLRPISKQMEIWKAPEILIIQLKRFLMISPTCRQKIDTMVHYPLSLELSPFVISPVSPRSLRYNLTAVLNHTGNSATSGVVGHYTAIAKNKLDGKWYSYNDMVCRPVVSEDAVVNEGAYLLFYQRETS
eukprot:TRINITY_DN14731_c0_g1_i1.p1 TRINITY_DN14731_c0_g1~~TRINITY_DN14731_c0_g1_i1.p1  ORF type:complete len:660 (-),score=116.12 TRINITY_DN14731_c0_g1_i1:46-2001(-)